ncbi:MAG TPA: DUF1634 domain-containing protein [Gemmatimonadaceae bacterium]|nr:DUF1634 domain-containing protein [Gemmatimonadaceae bacterium]
MATRRAEWNDERMEEIMGRLLRMGVIIAALIVATGGALYLAKYGHLAPAFGTFRGEPEDLKHARGILRAALDGRGRGLIQLGLLVLIATPVARVAFSILGFARERDWLYVVITALVLALLLMGLFGSPI